MKPSLTFLSVGMSGIGSDREPELTLSTPSGQLREVPLTGADLIHIIEQAAMSAYVYASWGPNKNEKTFVATCPEHPGLNPIATKHSRTEAQIVAAAHNKCHHSERGA